MNQQSNTTILLAVYKILVSAEQGYIAKESIMLEDPGSTHSIITHQLVHYLGLRSEQITIEVNLPEKQHKVHHSNAYRFYITNGQGLSHKVRTIGMDEPHLLSGQFKVYGDLIKKYQDFTVNENLVGLFRVPSSEFRVRQTDTNFLG